MLGLPFAGFGKLRGEKTGGIAMRREALFRRVWCIGVLAVVVSGLRTPGIAQQSEEGAAAEPAAAVAAAAETPAVTTAEQDLTIPLPEPGPLPGPGQLGGGITSQRFHGVHLRVDGNLAGRVSVIEGSGRLIPARATITFMREGRVVMSVRSDEMGNFQAVGLRPGPYSVIATDGRAMTADTREYVGAISVVVLPYDPTVSPEQSILHMTLMPVDDLSPLLGRGEEVPAAEAMIYEGYPMMGGGGGGGGEGLAALLGLAGLAGLAGSQGGGARVPPVASPFVP